MRLTSELAKDAIKTYGKSRVETRFDALYEELNTFIRNSEFSESLTVNQELLAISVNDYFTNINTICQFRGINHVNEQEIVSYTAYWLL